MKTALLIHQLAVGFQLLLLTQAVVFQRPAGLIFFFALNLLFCAYLLSKAYVRVRTVQDHLDQMAREYHAAQVSFGQEAANVIKEHIEDVMERFDVPSQRIK